MATVVLKHGVVLERVLHVESLALHAGPDIIAWLLFKFEPITQALNVT